jgi:hypothetical protein
VRGDEDVVGVALEVDWREAWCSEFISRVIRSSEDIAQAPEERGAYALEE